MTTNKIFLAVLVSAAFIDAVSSKKICCGCFSLRSDLDGEKACIVEYTEPFNKATEGKTPGEKASICKDTCMNKKYEYSHLQGVDGDTCSAAHDAGVTKWCKDVEKEGFDPTATLDDEPIHVSLDRVAQMVEQIKEKPGRKGGKPGRKRCTHIGNPRDCEAALCNWCSGNTFFKKCRLKRNRNCKGASDSSQVSDAPADPSPRPRGNPSAPVPPPVQPRGASPSAPVPPPVPTAGKREEDALNAQEFSFWIMGGEKRVDMLKARFAKIRELYPGSHVDVCTFSETTRVEKVLRDVGLIDSIDCIHGRIGPGGGTGSSMWSHSPPLQEDKPKKTRTKHLVLGQSCYIYNICHARGSAASAAVGAGAVGAWVRNEKGIRMF